MGRLDSTYGYLHRAFRMPTQKPVIRQALQEDVAKSAAVLQQNVHLCSGIIELSALAPSKAINPMGDLKRIAFFRPAAFATE